MKNKNLSGRFTMPVEEGMDEQLAELIKLWKADAVRNSDGTQLSMGIAKYVDKVYNTFFPVRQDLEYAAAHPESLQEMYLVSEQNIAKSDTLVIDILAGYYSEQCKVDLAHDPKEWWEVMDRTTGEVVPASNWEQENGIVTIHDAQKYHAYTVTFWAWQTWDPTQMYNHITNNWGDSVPHAKPYNPVKPEVYNRMMEFYENWLKENPEINVVRFTTFFYHFTLIFNHHCKDKFFDWFGYTQTQSPEMLLAFEKEYGYRPRPEDFVDEGYHNSTFRVPTKEFLDYMDFVMRFVAKTARDIVDLTHKYGREAMMFLGDNYIGTEPYGPYWKSIGLDAVVGSVNNGTSLRMIADIPDVTYREGRFMPYFFPDTFYDGNEEAAVRELNDNWLMARRAIMRKPVDRIGYGGYPSLVMKFPSFINRVTEICDEFREIYDNMGGSSTKPYTPTFKVAILNAWGSLRTWQTHMIAHSAIFKQTKIYLDILESLSGASVDVEFISFDEIKRNGVSEDIGVIINAGNAYTAFSGGEHWIDPEVVSIIREWVDNGGGFIGVGEPSAYQHQGRYFQLADVLGFDKEIGFSMNTLKYNYQDVEAHFITEGLGTDLKFGEYRDDAYKVCETAQNIIVKNGCTMLGVNQYGKGRGVYLAGMELNDTNIRLLMQVIYWAASKESEFYKWHTDNIHVECAAYPETGCYAVVNNSNDTQETNLYLGDGSKTQLTLKPMELRWYNM